MVLYLTSSPTGTYLKWDEKEFDGLNKAYGFVDELRSDLDTEHIRCLMVAADPYNYDNNDWMLSEFRERLEDTGFHVDSMDMCDGRNGEEITNVLCHYNLIILGGGHVPTQNEFLHRIGLGRKLSYYDGVVMGISAGSMNAAKVVYAQPEEPGESTDPNYKRFLPGLGLTDINVLPHYNAVKDFWLDGRRLFEDITYEDSIGREFFAVCDGSFIIQRHDGLPSFHGEIYRIADGCIERI